MTDTQKIILLGLGGQGVLFAGKVIAHAAFLAGYQSSFIPSYGPEVQNGSVKAEVIISKNIIYNPFIDKSDYLLIFHKFRLKDSKNMLEKDGVMLCKDFNTNGESDYLGIKVNTEQIMANIDNTRVTNMSMVGAFTHYYDLINDKNIGDALKQILSNKQYNIISLNFKAYKLGKESMQVMNKTNA